MAITPLPTPPSRQDPTNFNARADAFLGALPTFATETNATADNVVAKEASAVAAANAAVAVSNTTKWVSGTTYAEGAAVWSPINGFTYRRITASGSGTTDPSLDTTNYAQISGSGNLSASSSTLSYDGMFLARQGVPGTGNTNKTGFAFIGDTDTGLFSSSGALKLFIDSLERATLSGDSNQTAFALNSNTNSTYIYNNFSSGAFGVYNATGTKVLFESTYAGVFKFDSGYGSASPAYGVRAWVNFDGTGTSTGQSVSIRRSANVSSVVDNGVGFYTVNLTSAMPDTNYSVVASANKGNDESWPMAAAPSSVTTTSFQLTGKPPGFGSQDYIGVCVAVIR